MKKKYEIVIVGSGPSGATLARELSRAGRDVLLIEKGKDWRNSPFYGTYFGCLFYIDKSGLLFTQEGLNIIRGILTGGSTNLYCATAARPPEWLKNKYKIDIEKYVDETIKELNIKPLPQELLGEASKRCMEAANEIGLTWEPLPKFMDISKCRYGFDCGAKCMLGCRCGAKWTANEYIDEAKKHGCEVLTSTEVEKVLIYDKQASGVKGKIKGKIPFEIEGDIIILSAGGIGTPIILQNSGLNSAGKGLLMDPTVMVYGVYKGEGSYLSPPMTVGSYEDRNGYILSHLIDPYLLFPIIMAFKGIKQALKVINYKKMLGIMIKLKDEISGYITKDGKISKPLTEEDNKKLKDAIELSKRILLKAGCEKNSLIVTPVRGTHPSGTVRIGELLDTNLQTYIKNLFVCDASVFPEALDRPVVLTVISLSKYLSNYILEKFYK